MTPTRSTHNKSIAVSPMVTAAQIFGRRVAPAPWPLSRPLLATANALLPLIADDEVAALVENLTRYIVDLEEELGAVRLVLSEALKMLHAQHVQIVKLKTRLGTLLDADRAARRSGAHPIPPTREMDRKRGPRI